MGILGKAIKWIVTAPFIAIDYALESIAEGIVGVEAPPKGKIASAIKWIVTAPFTAIDYALESIAEGIVGVKKPPKKRKPPSEKIRAALRKQWLELEPGEKGIPGVEWEGEIYYETPK